MKKTLLPIDDVLDRIKKSLQEEQKVIIVSPPGSGKTTRVPPALTTICPKK